MSYATEHKAKMARKTLDKYGASVKTMRIYKCPNCYQFHFTSRPD